MLTDKEGSGVARENFNVTDAELAVLEVLWTAGPATISQITAQLYPKKKTSQYATVQKLLERLEHKQYVQRDRSSFAHVFNAAIERNDLIGQQLQEVAEKLCDGSLTPLLMHLAEGTRLSRKDREILRKLIEEPDK